MHLLLAAINDSSRVATSCFVQPSAGEVQEDNHRLELVTKELEQSRRMVDCLIIRQDQIKEDERNRIAREIHDDLGQNLMALRIDVSMLEARTKAAHPKLNEKTRTVLRNIDSTIESVRSIVNGLRPRSLEQGLQTAIQMQVKEFQRRHGIVCELLTDEGNCFSQLDSESEMSIFRVLQEALTNISRHANASVVRIAARRQNNQFCMTISDNGVGVSQRDRKKPNTIGLVGMAERIKALGGTFFIDSRPGQGITLTVCLNLHPE